MSLLQTLNRVKEKENNESLRRPRALSRHVATLKKRGATSRNGNTASTGPQTIDLKTNKDSNDEFILVRNFVLAGWLHFLCPRPSLCMKKVAMLPFVNTC